MRWYFARPTSDTDTEFEVTARQHFTSIQLENPNATLHQHGFSALGMEYLFYALAMLPAYDGCVALDLPNGQWSAGVARETNWFLQHHRPVFRLCYDVTPDDEWSFCLEVMSSPITDSCSVEHTRALVHYYKERPFGGRSYQDRLITPPSLEQLGLQPQRATPPPIY